jgi:protein arginine kinase activator
MPLGCCQCYETFADQIQNELISSGRVPGSLSHIKSGTPMHVGRSPGETVELSPSLRLKALNQALADTLKGEDYEQAAWLRDQIKQLTEKSNEGQQ